MAWVLWLAAPVAATLVACVVSWLRNRPLPLPDTDEAMRAHTDYLAALQRVPVLRERDDRPGS